MDRFENQQQSSSSSSSTDFYNSSTFTADASSITNPTAERNQFGAILERHMERLSAEDQAVLATSRRQFINHATSGSYLGLAVGLTFAFRKRLFFGGRPLFKLTPYIPIAGATKEESMKAAKDHAFAAGQRLRKIFWRGTVWGFTGALAGLQMGIFTGSRAGKVTLASRPGVEQRGSQAIKNAIKENTQTHNDIYNFYNKPSELVVEAEAEAAAKEKALYGESDFDAILSKSRPSTTPLSRWDAIRKEDIVPSAWAAVRDSEKARSNSVLPTGEQKIRSKVRAPGELPEPGSDEMFGTEDKEERNKAFERMMEKERTGSRIGSGFN